MPPELWQSVNTLLVLDWVGDRTAEMQLNPALQVLHHTLPEAAITLLAVKEARHESLSLDCQWQSLAQFCSGSTTPDHPTFIENSWVQLIQKIRDRAFDAAIIFTAPSQSPYSLAYLCYLAGIPIRIGQSREFGGGVLSFCIQPPLEPVPLQDYYLHLLKSAGFPIEEPIDAKFTHVFVPAASA
jgi:ADP-heptose:LPS heptosyltransferase